jgi:hypothetical protein
MSKRPKRTPPPPPALTEKDLAHLRWVQQNITRLVGGALKLYGEGGRGAFIVREEDAKPAGTAARYLTSTSVNTTGIGWPDEKVASRVRTYNPIEQFVIVFLYRSGATSSYTIRFVQREDTFAVEAT